MPGYANPQSLNRFSYVNNNPLRYIDPTGHRACDDFDSNGGCVTAPGGGGMGFGGVHPKKPKDNKGNDGFHPTIKIVIPNLPCGGMMTCPQQSVYDFAGSLLPFTSSEACYFLSQDPVLCNSSSWQNLPNVSITSGPPTGMPPLIANYCGNSSGLACGASLTQDLATLTDLVGVGLIEGPAVGAGCIGGGPAGCAIAEVGVVATWTLTLNNVETGASSFSLVLTVLDDFRNNGGWGENSSTSLATWGAGLAPFTPSWDLAVDTYASGYNHGIFNGVDTIWPNGLFR